MKLHCVVEVNNRLLPSLALNSRRGQKSTLRIASNGTTSDSAVILHQTNDNVSGTVYKIANNIETVFSRFISEGKSTIRLKVPKVDLAIKADPLELKCFLKTLACMLRKDSPVSKLPQLYDAIALKLAPTQKKTKLVIASVSEFPAGRYPTTLTTLQINSVRLKTIDSRITRLTALQILNISNNQITRLPKELGFMNLKELHLSGNRLGSTQNWNWVCYDQIQNSLQLLDLANNELKCLPVEIGRLKKLVTLKLSNNEIVRLPPGIGRIGTLQYLSISQNKIEWLPSTFKLLSLSKFDISGNCFKVFKGQDQFDFKSTSLKQLAAAVVLDKKLAYSPATLPPTLISYLDCFGVCKCGYPTLTKSPLLVVEFRSHRITSSLICDAPLGITSTMGLQFCRFACADNALFVHKSNPFNSRLSM
ncbi:hypothetical protein LSTR_LSTR009249 [Laodelphax striatellus]|uniref:PIF1/LRR1 pleckstrin homology domain-containing protein n=1 Tax=Laodelphax striatellus TaxID=195883 RepID=A0A482XD89_LAOST|nr:hypothetical protein LSTR_LSTR009249 [Laodelphax striatellus]